MIDGLKIKLLALLCIGIILISLFSVISIESGTGIGQSDDIVMIENADSEAISELNRMDVEILDRYGDYVVLELKGESMHTLKRSRFEINDLSESSHVSVKGNSFDINDGEPDLEDSLTIEEYDSEEKGLYVINMIGPINPEWMTILEEKGVEVINYVPNYAFEVSMTPEQAEELEELFFIDWTGIYHPDYKIHSEIDMENPGRLNVRIRPGYDEQNLRRLQSRYQIHGFEDLREDGLRVNLELESFEELKKLANINDVYYISPYIEPELHGEVDAQIIGGGAWIMDDEHGTPDEPYRKHGNFGAYINQIGYSGDGVTVAVADTGVGDGTIGDAGHPDFTGRVIDGYGFQEEDEWQDGHGHGTHVLGSAAGDTHHGDNDDLIYGGVYPGFAPYYMGQGLAYESEIFSTKIFDDGGAFLPEEYYPIVEVPQQESDTYVHMNSWGSGSRGDYSDSDEVYDQAVRDSNRDVEYNEPMVITSSAGNDGQGGEQTTGSPGHAKNVISVGATESYKPDGSQHGGQDTDNPDYVADFSSRGWTTDNRIKPDVVAPGDNILSTASPEAHDEPTYSWMSGTSMSNPAVAGAAAVVVEWYEENYGERPSPAMVRSILINTAHDLDDANGNTGPIPNRYEGWGMVDISKLEYPYESPIQFTFEDQNSLLTTGETNEYYVSAHEDDEPLKITLTWTDENALAGDSDGGTPTLKNNLDLEVVNPEGEVIRGNAFDLSGDGESDDGFTYPDAEVMEDFDYNDDGWDDVNNVQNVYIPPDQLQEGPYTIRVRGTNVPADANNDGEPNQDYALSVFNTEPPSDGIIRMDSDRYAVEDTVNLTVLDGDLGEQETLDVGILSDTDPDGINVTLDGSEGSFEFTGSVEISGTDNEDLLLVSDGDTIKAEYWDEDTGDGEGALKTDTATIDGEYPQPPLLRDVDWHGFQRVDSFHDDVEDGDLGYTSEKTHEEASDWEILSNDSAVGDHSWDFGDGEYNKTSDQGMRSSLISPEIELKDDADELTLSFEHWRSFNSLFDGSNLKISTEGNDGPWEIIEPQEGYDGSIIDGFGNPMEEEPAWGYSQGWETVVFDLINYTGEEVHFRWDVGTEAGDEDAGEGWRIDDITVTFENMNGTQHNRLEWDKSIDEHISQYNIYRSDDPNGPWNESTYLDSVHHNIDNYVDQEAGEIDDERWWYVVRAQKDVGYEEDNEISVPEPGGPSLDITSPEEDSIFADGNVTVTWEGSPEIEEYEIKLNDEENIDVGENTEYNFENLTDTVHKVSIYGYTENEEIGFDDVHFAVDTQPPEIEIIRPLHDSFVSDNNVTVEWRAEDEVSGVDYHEVRLDEGEWIELEETEHTFYSLENEQTYTVEVRSWDEAGWYSTESATFTVDTSDPELEITSPLEGEILRDDVMVEWEGSDDLSGIAGYELIVNEEVVYEGEETEYELTDLEDGTHEVEVIAEDNAGNTQNSTVEFMLDTVPPELEILEPRDGDIFSEDTVYVEWEVSDNLSGVASYELRLNSELVYDGEEKEYELTDLEDGTHEVEVIAEDNAGNERTKTIDIIVDTSPPGLETLKPQDGDAFSGDTLIIQWEGNDEISGISGYELIVNGETVYEGEETEYELTSLEDGTHEIEVIAEDNAGNSESETSEFKIDNEQPEVEIIRPEDGDLFADDTLMVEWEGSDELSGIAGYELIVNGEVMYEGEDTEYELSGLEDGNNDVKVIAEDNAGNTRESVVEIMVDTTPPELEVLEPKEGGIFSDDTVLVEWEGSDELSGIAGYELRLNDDLIYQGEETEYELTDLEDGTHLVEIIVADNAGNEQTKTVNFIIDTQEPTLNIIKPETDQIFSEDTVDVEWEGSDELSGIAGYELMVNGEVMYEGEDTEYELSGLEDGNNEVKIIAEDNAGNTRESVVKIMVDTTPPELEIITPQDGGVVTEDTVLVEWEASDELSGIAGYELIVNGELVYEGEDTEYELSGLEDGDNTIEVRAIDNAGNSETQNITISVERGLSISPYIMAGITIIILLIVGIIVYKKKKF